MALSSAWRPHCGVGNPIRRIPILVVGSGPAWVFSPHFVKEDLSAQRSVSNVVRTTSVSGKISHPLSEDGEIAVMKGY